MCVCVGGGVDGWSDVWVWFFFLHCVHVILVSEGEDFSMVKNCFPFIEYVALSIDMACTVEYLRYFRLRFI